ncbi:MAG: adenosylcobalamin-dependent ribonucleoside-diphosphate reductase [Candidatus Nanoarchaeia archaeon]
MALPFLGAKEKKKIKKKFPKILQVQKRDGSFEKFKPEKITNAISKAFSAIKTKDGIISKKIANEVVKKLEEKFAGKIPHVENIQDIVEETLMQHGYAQVAKAYILYRQKRAELRAAKELLEVKDELNLGLNALTVLQKRYLLKDENGKIIETPAQMFRRVARAIAAVEAKYKYSKSQIKNLEDQFYNLMANLEFIPNSPTLMNAGTSLGLYSACFVLPVPDDLKGIMKSLSDAALIQKGAGGTGFSFSRLRPKGDLVKSTKGVASGPLSFAMLFDKVTDVIKAGGKRRGANMAVIRVDHPDVIDFIIAKSNPEVLRNFNISIAITNDFMKAVKENKEYPLINPRNNQIIKRLNARDVWSLIVSYAWKTGDPGIIFIDEINKRNPTAHIGEIEATNPCGEQPLHPYESCNLGSINLTKILKKTERGYEIDWKKLENIVKLAVRFLDDVIDAQTYIIPEIEAMTKANRRIGLGIMGWADMLCYLGISYASKKAIVLAEKLMKFISDTAHKASSELGKEKGNFPNFKGSLWEKKGWKFMRNATCTTIAPTGSISIIAGCSSGIEPLFAISYVRHVLEGTRLLEVNPVFEKITKEKGIYSEVLMSKIAKSGSLQNIKEIPEDVKKVFVTALDISPEWHVKMQAAFQKYTDNAVSKTINFPPDATTDDIRKAFELAYKLKCKGITVYRYGSKPEQVLYIGELEKKVKAEAEPFVIAPSETSGWCASPLCPVT